jgi:long-chain acyl-CoA synthetase
MNLASRLTERAATQGDRPAVRLADAVTTYAQMEDAAAAFAGLLRDKGVGPGDRVALMMPNVPPFPVVYYAILRLGAVVVPLNPLLKGREVEYHLADSGARVLVVWEAFADEATAGAAASGAEVVTAGAESFRGLLTSPPVAEVVDRDGDDTAVILYTSGTTGRPKGAELTHAGLSTNAEITSTTLIELTPDDVIFGGLPLFHAFGQTAALNTAIFSGASITLLPRFEPQTAVELIAAHRVTAFLGVPTMYAAILTRTDPSQHDVSSLRVCVSGGSAMPVEVMRGFEKSFDCIVLEGYGLSETSPVASFNHPDRPRKPGSIGTPIRGVEMRAVDPDGVDVPMGEVGEIVIRGHNVMKGYWRNPEATAASIRDGWFHTGDLARVDEDGYFFIVDRVKDLIIRGGMNVYPREVEEVLYEHPAVAEAAVVGVPHPELGEDVGAMVALRPGASATEEELRDFVKAQVAPHKYPRHIWFGETLPKGPTGKILKREIVRPTPG